MAIVRSLDWWLMLPVLLLVSYGLAELYSLDASQGGKMFDRQLIVALVGLLLMAAILFVDYYVVYSATWYIYLVGIFTLLLVLLFGARINGTRGWLRFAGLTAQPVEFIKIMVIVSLSRYFASANFSYKALRSLVVSFLIVLVPIILVMLQPDLGSAMVLGAIWFLLLIFAGLPRKYIFTFLASLLLIGALSWNHLAPYQRGRVMNILAPKQAGLTGDYNVNQAIIAVGSGRFLGRGLGFGSQSQLRFLPESKNDFIFAVIAEELGFVGILLVVGCFGLILYRIFHNLPNIKDNFGIFFLLGFAGLIFTQMFINIGMNLGLLPVVGITLPFLSYGGSSLLTNLLLVGIAQSIIVRSKIKNY